MAQISIALEEMGLPYTVHAVDIVKDEQFKPNSSRSAEHPHSGYRRPRQRLSRMDSGRFSPVSAQDRKLLPQSGENAGAPRMLNWQMFCPGPMLGQCIITKLQSRQAPYAEERLPKAPLYNLSNPLSDHEYVAATNSIADIAIWPWIHLFEGRHRHAAVSERAALVHYIARAATQKGYKCPRLRRRSDPT